MIDNSLDIKIHYKSESEIKITASIITSEDTLVTKEFLTSKSGEILLTANIPTNIDTKVILTCNDPRIYHYLFTVTGFELDNFYLLKTFAYTGTNVYDQKYLDYTKVKNIIVNEQSNSNCLFFTGSLVYKIISPLSGMIFGRKNTLGTSR